jgi:hypothetical protein
LHASGPGQAGHHRAEECGEPGQEHCASTLRPQRLPSSVKTLLAAGEDPGREQVGPEVSADLVAIAVTGDRGYHRDRGHGHQRHLLAVGQYAAEQHRSFAGEDEAYE